MIEKLKRIDGKKVNVKVSSGFTPVLWLEGATVEVAGTNVFFNDNVINVEKAVDCSTILGDLTFVAEDLLIRVELVEFAEESKQEVKILEGSIIIMKKETTKRTPVTVLNSSNSVVYGD